MQAGTMEKLVRYIHESSGYIFTRPLALGSAGKGGRRLGDVRVIGFTDDRAGPRSERPRPPVR
jgi:hypothetical protein